MPDDDSDFLPFPGTNVLRYKFGITDAAELQAREADLIAYRITQLRTEYTHGAFNAQHLQNLHRHIFQDLYDWAGQLRNMGVRSPGQGALGRSEHIESALDHLFDQLAKEGRLKGLPAPTWADRAAHYLGEIITLRPFREGNGPTTREFARELAEENGFRVRWQNVAKLDWTEAATESLVTAHNQQLRRVLLVSLDAEFSGGRPARGRHAAIALGRERDFLR